MFRRPKVQFLKITCALVVLLSPLSALACPETHYNLNNGNANLVLTEKQCAASVDYYISGPGGTAYLGSSSSTTFSNEPSGIIPPGYNQVVWNDIQLNGSVVARWGLASSSSSGFYGVLSIFQNSQIQGVFYGQQ